MPDLQPLVEDADERPSVEVMESFLGRQRVWEEHHCFDHVDWAPEGLPVHAAYRLATHAQIVTKAKRTFTGCLMCIDHFGNLLIFDAVEELSSGKQVHDRRLNQIIIALDTVTEAQVLVQQHDKVLQIMLEDEMRRVELK